VVADVPFLMIDELYGRAAVTRFARLAHQVPRLPVFVEQPQVVTELVGHRPTGLGDTRSLEPSTERAVQADHRAGEARGFVLVVAGAADRRKTQGESLARPPDVHIVRDEQIDAVVVDRPILRDLLEIPLLRRRVEPAGVGGDDTPVEHAPHPEAMLRIDVPDRDDGEIEVVLVGHFELIGTDADEVHVEVRFGQPVDLCRHRDRGARAGRERSPAEAKEIPQDRHVVLRHADAFCELTDRGHGLPRRRALLQCDEDGQRAPPGCQRCESLANDRTERPSRVRGLHRVTGPARGRQEIADGDGTAICHHFAKNLAAESDRHPVGASRPPTPRPPPAGHTPRRSRAGDPCRRSP
jgi:hypothetical protein